MRSRLTIVAVPIALALAIVSAGCGDDGPNEAERAAERRAAARERVTEAECAEVVAAQVEETDVLDEDDRVFDCRQAGWDPVFEEWGAYTDTEHYREYAATGQVPKNYGGDGRGDTEIEADDPYASEKAICADLRNGMSIYQVVRSGVDAGASRRSVASAMTVATEEFCPEYGADWRATVFYEEWSP